MLICTVVAGLAFLILFFALYQRSRQAANITHLVNSLKEKANLWDDTEIFDFGTDNCLTGTDVQELTERLGKRIIKDNLDDKKKNPYGTPVWYVNLIADHFIEKFDFCNLNKVLNQFRHFKTKIGDINLHFIHMAGDKGSIPIIMLHGWPSTVWEFHKSIPILIEQGYSVVVPSLPGHGFTDGPSVTGVSPCVIACAYHKLMIKLGYTKYVVHGGDWGAIIGSYMSYFYPENIVGYHTTMNPPAFGWRIILQTLVGTVFPSLVYATEQEKQFMHPLSTFGKRMYRRFAYFHAQSAIPDCYGYGMVDSPVGLIGWIGFVYAAASGGMLDIMEGIKNFGIDNICSNIALFWAAKNAQASMRIYYEFYWSSDQDIMGSLTIPETVPVAISNFPNEIFHMTKFVSKGRYKNIKLFTHHDKGGHFCHIDNTEGVVGDLVSFIKNHVSAEN